jgi:hypothetical protein
MTEQQLKDEREQAVKRGGEIYADHYIEGLLDGWNLALKISSNPLLSDVSFCSCEVETNKYFDDNGVKRCYDCKKEAKWNS